MSTAFSHITVPVDETSTSGHGIDFALDLAAGGATLTFCNVVDTAQTMVPVEGMAIDPQPMIDGLFAQGRSICQQALARATARGIAADVRVVEGERERAIEDVARESGSDAIVIGTHARTGIARTLLGSVAEGLMRRCEIPVIAVHATDVRRSGPVLTALDASSASEAAFATALALARSRDARLALITVVEPGEPHAPAVALLRWATARAEEAGVYCATHVGEGDPGCEILAECERIGAAMIVTGTHGRAALPRFFLGSVAADLLQRAHVPIVVVRTPRRALVPAGI
jgi:nucleotide-binding universal stress UspA family protein